MFSRVEKHASRNAVKLTHFIRNPHLLLKSVPIHFTKPQRENSRQPGYTSLCSLLWQTPLKGFAVLFSSLNIAWRLSRSPYNLAFIKLQAFFVTNHFVRSLYGVVVNSMPQIWWKHTISTHCMLWSVLNQGSAGTYTHKKTQARQVHMQQSIHFHSFAVLHKLSNIQQIPPIFRWKALENDESGTESSPTLNQCTDKPLCMSWYCLTPCPIREAEQQFWLSAIKRILVKLRTTKHRCYVDERSWFWAWQTQSSEKPLHNCRA